MKANINTTLIANLVSKDKPYDVRDANLTGFIVRVNISGKKVYMCEYARGKRITLGKVGVLSPAQARDRAKEVLADAVKGIAPNSVQKTTNKITFTSYIENHYKPWVESNRKRGKESVYRIRTHFLEKMGNKPLEEINSLLIEQWRIQRLKNGIKPITLNRDIAGLKAAISKAVEWELINANPLTKLKLSKIDTNLKVRYLTRQEEIQLRETLDNREEKLKLARESGNLWRLERGYPEMPNHIFADYMKPMILLSLNTGLRQGELFNLNWEDISFEMATLTVHGESAKSGKTRHVPLNSEALNVLQDWHQQTNGNGLIFSNKHNQRLNNVKKAWGNILKKANISQFRWHDMRHHFASSLVMAGVDLNTVRELLGHSDIKMTLRYAHLTPEHKANAVAKLVAIRLHQD